jgi:hypothetical protein
MPQSKMTDDRFWALIDQARTGSHASASPQRLTRVLEALSSGEIQDFNLAFHEKLCDLNLWRLWGAGYVISGGMGDDELDYFRSWIIGKGKAVFELALTNPDELAPFVDTREVDNEGLEYVPMEALKKRGIKEDPRYPSDLSADGEPEGEPFDEDTVAASVPKLSRAVDRLGAE